MRKWAAEEIARATSRYVRGEVIDFVDRLIQRLAGKKLTRAGLETLIKEQTAQTSVSQLAVTDDIWKQFLEDAGWDQNLRL